MYAKEMYNIRCIEQKYTRKTNNKYKLLKSAIQLHLLCYINC